MPSLRTVHGTSTLLRFSRGKDGFQWAKVGVCVCVEGPVSYRTPTCFWVSWGRGKDESDVFSNSLSAALCL